jgi:dTDP-4-amino-4,6-dideoxygalactose transaminase
MFGAPGPIREIKSMNLRVIEDCAQSIGATIDGDKLGAIGEVSIFSFYATKVICAGEGGAVASKSEELLDKVRDLRDYDHKLHYQLRFNYKMTDIQAGIARAQLKKLPDFIARRRTIAKMYNTAITSAGGNPLIRSQEDIYFRYLVKVRDIPTSIALFRKEGVCAERPVFQPIHRLLGLEGYNITEKLQNSLISLPCYPALSPGEIDTICKVLSKLGSACEK